MRSFQSAAVNSMSQSNPGFSGFMSNVTNPSNGAYGESQNLSGRGPPPPMATQGPNAIPSPQGRPGNNSYARPDLNFSKSNYVDDGISLRENFERPDVQDRTTRRPGPPRPEMKGPSDITDILSGLKTKTINIQETQPQQQSQHANDSSTISISDLNNAEKFTSPSIHQANQMTHEIYEDHVEILEKRKQSEYKLNQKIMDGKVN